MARYLLELFMEEIPARMQERAASQLKELLEKKFSAEGVAFENLKTLVSHRRLVANVEGLPSRQEDRVEEKKGPRVGAPEKALNGFLQSAGVTLADCEEREIPGKGAFYFINQTIKGKPIEEILTQMVEEIIQEFQWPKSMRWGSYAMPWVRPLRSILSLLDDKILPISVEDPHVTVGQSTHGHRFLAPETIVVKDFETYQTQLRGQYVLVDPEECAKSIKDQIQGICQEKGLVVKEDAGLLKEVTGLVEWPVVLLGKIDERFMTLPPEVLETTMKTHQKYFSVQNKDGTPAPYFLVVSNMETIDQGAQIVEGNERVLRARLSDAEFFWEQDQKKTLEEWNEGLESLIFHEKIGSVAQRIKRLKALVSFYFSGQDKLLPSAQKAAELAKADLVTGMVGEFPELQGIMGGYYASAQGCDSGVAEAIRDHYAPLGPEDHVPSAPVSVAVALADKVDTLVSFWAAGLTPTGSKDPYALRRSALGVIRLIFENKLSLKLEGLFKTAYDLLPDAMEKVSQEESVQALLEFFVGRLKVFFKDQGFDHTHIEAVISKGWDGDIQKSHEVLVALSTLLGTQVGQDLMTAYKRAANIVDQAEKKGDTIEVSVDEALFTQGEERALHEALVSAKKDIETVMADQEVDYGRVMERLSDLRKPMDDFFDEVTVQSDEADVRVNRLGLLAFARTLVESVADFSCL